MGRRRWNITTQEWKVCDVEIDFSSQSTVVNLGIKRKRSSMHSPWSQVQQNTCGSDNLQILGCLWTIHHRCTCDIEPICLLFLSRWEQRLYEFRFVWIKKDVGEKRATICNHWNANCLQKPRKYCQLETRASWWCHLQSTCF